MNLLPIDQRAIRAVVCKNIRVALKRNDGVVVAHGVKCLVNLNVARGRVATDDNSFSLHN